MTTTPKLTPEACQSAIQMLAKKIPLSIAKFNLLPTQLVVPTLNDPDEKYLQLQYQNCWETIFENTKCDSILRQPNAEQRLKELSEQSQCSIRMYLLAVMLSYKDQPQPFFASLLFNASAPQRVQLLRKECCRQFGTFDIQRATLLNSSPTQSNPELLASEILAGGWIVGHKLRCSGSPTDALYQSRELALSPFWLALEPTYLNSVLIPYWQHKTGTQQIHRHRFRVSRILAKLKKDDTLARQAFAAREALIHEAIRAVLNPYRLVAEDFEVPPVPVTEMVPLWSRIGLAIQHWYCLRWIQGDTEAMEKLT